MPASRRKDEDKCRSFNPWRKPASGPAETLIAHVQASCEEVEQHRSIRTRRRCERDQKTFLRTVEALVCDLIHLHHSRRQPTIRVSRSNDILRRRSRYRSPVHTKVLPDVLDLLSHPELGWIVQQKGEQGAKQRLKQTTIRLGRPLVDLIEAHDIHLRDILTVDRRDPIVLKRAKEDFWDEGGMIEYADTQKTRALRATMDGINHWLEAADIDLSSFRDEPLAFDLTDRRMRRIFTQGQFDCGGRLFGGFWQPMTKLQRAEHIIINGDQVVELDYGQMVLRTLYGVVGIDPGTDDLYGLPGLEDRREGVKKVVNAMLFHDKRVERFPKGTRPLFPKTITIHALVSMIEERHSLIYHLFYQGFGHRQQFLESQILIEVLLACKAEGIVALPIHDAILVSEHQSEQATLIMQRIFLSHTGIPAKV